MKIFCQRFLSVSFLLFCLSPLSFGTQITWTKMDSHTKNPVLQLWITDDKATKTVSLGKKTEWIDLVLCRTMYDGDNFVFLWSRNGSDWLSEQKKIPADTFQKRMYLPAGSTWNLEIRNSEGKTLAKVDFKR